MKGLSLCGQRLRAAALFLVAAALLSCGEDSHAETARSWLVTLPVLAVGGQTQASVGYNLGNQAALALEWGLFGRDEMLYKRELEAQPKASMQATGQDLNLMISRYSQPTRMAGFHWALGAGVRRWEVDWRKNAAGSKSLSPLDRPQIADERGLVSHRIALSGSVLSARVGYRFVGQDIGFLGGIFLGLKHFQSKVSDRTTVKTKGQEEQESSPMPLQDRLAMKRRFMSSLQPGLELGWTF